MEAATELVSLKEFPPSKFFIFLENSVQGVLRLWISLIFLSATYLQYLLYFYIDHFI